MKFIDSHAHLTSPDVLRVVDEVVDRASQAGIETIINICTDRVSLEEGLKLHKRKKRVFNTAATTPHDVEKEGETFFPYVEAHAQELVGIGETGLDYYYEHSPKKIQREFLSRYFDLAKKYYLPIIFHCREAFDDLFALADENYVDLPAVLHCFTGTKEEAKKCLNRGWFVSFSGIITFKNSQALRDVVKYVPLDRLFIETDTPYLSPESKRGKKNEPAHLIEIAQKIAEIKEVDLYDIEKTTSENISRFFHLS